MAGPLTTASTLVVAEVFGPTIQGEGPSAGRRAGFIRLGGCNLHCDWCDTKQTWDASSYDLHAELARVPVDAIADRALAGSPALVVITGGEPLLHQRQPGWEQLLTLLDGQAAIEVETNGTIAPTVFTAGKIQSFNVSPKLASGGDPEPARIRPHVLRAFGATNRAVFKFVCTGRADVAEAAAVARAASIDPERVWIMPEGTTAAAVTAGFGDLADAAIEAGFSVTTRLHVLAWGNERGR